LFRIASPTARSIWAAVRIAPVIFSPCCFLREPDQIRAGDVVVVPDLGRRIREKKPSAVLVLMSYSPPRL